MDRFINYLEANLTPEELKGCLKGIIAAAVMGCDKDAAHIYAAKRYVDKLAQLCAETSSKPETETAEEIKPLPGAGKKPARAACVSRMGIDVKKVKELYIEKGLTAKECCKALNVSGSTLRRILADNGITKQPRTKKADYGSAQREDKVSDAAREAAREILGAMRNG